MFRNISSLGWMGLTLTMGMVACYFPQSPVLAQYFNPSSADNEDKTIFENWHDLPDTPINDSESLANRSISYKEDNPPAICQFPKIRNIFWKCSKSSTTDTANSPQLQNTNSQENNQPASIIQPPKK